MAAPAMAMANDARIAGGELAAEGVEACAPVAILAPTGRDGVVAERVLARAGFRTRVCADMTALCAAVRDDAGVLLVAEEALSGSAREALLAALDAQPSWSDVPVVLLTGEEQLSRALGPTLRAVATRANVTLIERPVRVATLVTAIRSALRARGRQLDVRDHLAERSASERALLAARRAAEEANRTKGEFLAVMSHELRTPLNAIGGYAQLLQLGIHGPVTDQQQNAISRIQRSQRHLLALINDLLNFTKLEAGHVEYAIADVPVRSAIDALETLVAPQLAAKSLRFSRAECPYDCVARADPDKLQQILVNLLSNAIKFTPEGGAVTVACEPSDGGVRIDVRDSGIGIAADRLEQVFAPFVQVDRRPTSTNEGVGLGLAISRDLARGMGGDLTAESTPGEGSTFTLTLPRAG
jgi:signal transduction histidine kinase